MDYLALKIPADIKQPITSHTVKDQPEPEDGGCYPFSGAVSYTHLTLPTTPYV